MSGDRNEVGTSKVPDERFLGSQLRPRRRWYTVLLAVSLIATAAGVFVWFRYEDRQEAVRLQEAHFAGCPKRPECKQRGPGSAPPREKWSSTLDCVAAEDTDCVAARREPS